MVVRYPNSVLIEPTQKVDFTRDDVKRLTNDMYEMCRKEKGIGLAANQFSDLTTLSMFVIDFDSRTEKDHSYTGVFINPEIISHSNETVVIPEGCLSFPGVRVNKERWKTIKIRWKDVEDGDHEDEFDGMKSVVLQHEYDHVGGKTIISSLPGLKQKLIVEKMRKNMIKSARQRAKEMNIRLPSREEQQERIDVETGKRTVDE